MSIEQPQLDLPKTVRGGSVLWDTESAANIVLNGDWFTQAVLQRLKRWDGSQWAQETLKYWNGSQWLTGVLRYWNGSNWTV